MVRRLNVLLLALLGVIAGREGRVRAQEARREDSGVTGAVSEDEFKAMHERPHDRSPRLLGETIQLGEDRAYLSLPKDGAPPRAALVVVHEWWGLNDHVKHWTDRLAAEGYAALAVDLYGGRAVTTSDEALALMKAVDPAVALARMRAGVAHLRQDERVKASRVGVIGWCFGGAQALQLALNEPSLSAAAVYYGRLETDPERLKSIKAAVVGVFGTRDRSIPQETVDAFEQGLKAAGVTHEVHRFDAEHAFANPSNPRYQSEAAAAAWARVRTFLARHLRP